MPDLLVSLTSSTFWTPSTAPITLNSLNNNLNVIDDCLVDLNFETINDQSLDDNSGNTNLGIFIGDYKVSFDNFTNEPKKDGTFKTMVLGQKPKKKAF